MAGHGDSGLVDVDGLVAGATGANGRRRVSAPGVASVAAALPAVVIDNASIGSPLGVDSDWISSRTGVLERRRATDESLVDLAANAGAKALSLAEIDHGDIDLVLVATFTPDDLQPHAAPVVADRLGAGSAAAIDVGAACTGFVAALVLAAGQLEAGRAGAALVIGADLMSRVVDYGDRQTAGLFGDGAGAAVLTAGGPGRIGELALRSNGARSGLITASHDDRLLRMDGRATFRAAVSSLSAVTREVLSGEGLALDEVDLFVFHQANSRIISAVGDQLGLRAEQVIDCIERYGNTSAASIPIALADAASEGRLQPGSRVLVAAFGAGLTWGAAVLEWDGRA